jgi:hypothetical protein
MQRMTSRREFLQIGIAASSLPLASQVARAASIGEFAQSRAPVPLYKVVYDSRFPATVAFGDRARALGADVHAIDGDMTRLWFDDIYHRWAQSPVAIAGLTAHGPLFCFERLAWDQGLRVVFRAEHGPDAEGVLRNVVSGPRSMLDLARAALDRNDWSAAMADVVTRCPSGKAEIDSFEVAARHASAALATESLYSWVIAPAARS